MKDFHPIAILALFSAMIGGLMISDHPIFIAVSLLGALSSLFALEPPKRLKGELFGYITLLILMMILNPLLVHRGSTPLLFINGKAITREAILFGIDSSFRLFSGILWCRGFSIAMTSERLFCLTGKLSPKLTAVLMMSVGFVPKLVEQSKRLDTFAPRSENSSIFCKLRRKARIFSALVTRAIEDGMQSADSMSARGFELGGRTSYSRFRIRSADIVLILLSAVSLASCLIFGRDTRIVFYPAVTFPNSPTAVFAVSASAACAFIFPIILKLTVDFKKSEVCGHGNN